MIIYLDENIPSTIAKGFHHLQLIESSKAGLTIEIRALVDDFGEGCKDEDWIPEVGKRKCCVITQDLNIHRMRAQRELYSQYNIGLFFIKPPSKTGLSYWEMVKLLINNWQNIIKIIKTETMPFSYKISVKGKFEKL